jgi:hypothetical protein
LSGKLRGEIVFHHGESFDRYIGKDGKLTSRWTSYVDGDRVFHFEVESAPGSPSPVEEFLRSEGFQSGGITPEDLSTEPTVVFKYYLNDTIRERAQRRMQEYLRRAAFGLK